MPLVPPPVIALGFGLAQRALPSGQPGHPAGRAGKAAAAAVTTGSLALLAGSAREFQRAATTVHPLHPEKASTLVTTGPNRLTRNPMYVGMAGLLAAHALVRGGVWPWLPVAGFVAVIDVAQIRPEERAMRSLFGVEYDAYRRTTRRWL